MKYPLTLSPPLLNESEKLFMIPNKEFLCQESHFRSACFLVLIYWDYLSFSYLYDAYMLWCRWTSWWSSLVEVKSTEELWRKLDALIILVLPGKQIKIYLEGKCATNLTSVYLVTEEKWPAHNKNLLFLIKMAGSLKRFWLSMGFLLVTTIMYGPFFFTYLSNSQI